MWYKLVLFCLKKLTPAQKKGVVLRMVEDMLSSNKTTLDQEFAELLMSMVAKSNGNNITAYLVKD